MAAILSNFTVLCLSSDFVVYFLKLKLILVAKISETKLDDFYQLELSYYYLRLYWVFSNVSAAASSGLPPVFLNALLDQLSNF